MQQIYVVGGGPSGMMAAISSKMHWPDAQVVLLDKNRRLGTKMRLSGGGRCNVTADVSIEQAIEYIPKNGKFLYSALTQFGPKEVMDFFENNGCPLKMEDHRRMFPQTNRSHTVVESLVSKLNELNVEIRLATTVDSISEESIVIEGKSYPYDAVILATGSRTLPETGSDGNGYELAKQLNHSITDLVPAEVPLVSNDLFIQEKTLQGLSFHDVALSVYKGKKIVKTITHDLLFAHFGISGPAALRGSFYVLNVFPKERPVRLSIDFLPEVSFETLSQSDDVSATAQELGLPKRLLSYIESITTNKNEFINGIKKFEMTVYETRGFAKAFVTNGGVNLKEIDPKTLKSKINPKISMVGELLDYNAYTGGFNITSALSTGFVAGKNALSYTQDLVL